MKVQHKSNKTNLVPDTLLRLMLKFKQGIKKEEALKKLLIYNCTLIKLANNFKAQLKKAYKKDKQ